jgi:hypothetical protein
VNAAGKDADAGLDGSQPAMQTWNAHLVSLRWWRWVRGQDPVRVALSDNVLWTEGVPPLLDRRHPGVAALVANWRTRRARRHVAAPVPAATEVGRELRGAERPRSGDNRGSFSVGSADHPALEARGTHAEC